MVEARGTRDLQMMTPPAAIAGYVAGSDRYRPGLHRNLQCLRKPMPGRRIAPMVEARENENAVRRRDKQQRVWESAEHGLPHFAMDSRKRLWETRDPGCTRIDGASELRPEARHSFFVPGLSVE